jgi:transposase
MATSNYPHGKLPVKISRKNFNTYIDPYLSKSIYGPPCKISRYKIFNYILFVLHTGIQWRQLPVYRHEIHWSNVYRWHNKWSKDGSYRNLFETGVQRLFLAGKLDLSVLHGDGSNTITKKGALASATLGTNTRPVKKS